MLKKVKSFISDIQGVFFLFLFSQGFPFLFYVWNNYHNKGVGYISEFEKMLTGLIPVLGIFLGIGLIGYILSKKHYKKILYFLIILNFIFNGIELGVYLNFAIQIVPEFFYIVFETNKNEALEFVGSYCNWHLYIVLVYFLLGIIIYKSRDKFKGVLSRIFLFTIIPLIVYSSNIEGSLYMKKTHIFKSMYRSIKRYRGEMEDLKNIDSSFGKTYNKFTAINNEKEATYVLIIGESFNRNHSSLYGYKRDTQPYLDSQVKSGNLYVFKDVISPHYFTRETLKKLVTTTAWDNKIKFSNSINLVDIMKKAGFKTYWLSNQEDFAFKGASLSSVIHRADEVEFTESYYSDTKDKLMDEALLPLVDKISRDKNRKKFIVIHLFGSHREYIKRYPKEFTRYNLNECPSFFSEIQKRNKEMVNAYDNSIYYNDFIIKNIITKLEKTNPNMAVLYLSDHGQSLGEKIDYFGNLDPNREPSGVEIPFMIWTSDTYKINNRSIIENIKESENKPYISEDIIYTLVNLYNVNFSKEQENKSIINKNFKEKRRVVTERNETYEELRGKNEENPNV
ncbi:heptose-I-phosphate ethanolaminephosphotransferase [Cetobacterium ceti]|uniref:Heptose-I-phosphate ethanolaminephosphotransferase n=1 Tax=Cetobacterium ceti TaxID=180163 RepID=A0A1T4LR93_9FUSO|nr:phosphoethanolamine transferase [Cetobacterium ceti]SJZ57171.1 heptose-I-phosphate ethanolaminephosphotransferase [Cetobacterium ceti]